MSFYKMKELKKATNLKQNRKTTERNDSSDVLQVLSNRFRQDEVVRNDRNLFSGGQPIALDVDVQTGRGLCDGRLESGDSLAFAEMLEDEAENNRIRRPVELGEKTHQKSLEE